MTRDLVFKGSSVGAVGMMQRDVVDDEGVTLMDVCDAATVFAMKYGVFFVPVDLVVGKVHTRGLDGRESRQESCDGAVLGSTPSP